MLRRTWKRDIFFALKTVEHVQVELAQELI